MKKVLFTMLAVVLAVSLLFPSVVLADQQKVDGDIFSPGLQNIVDLSAAPGATVNTSAQILVERSGGNHLSLGNPLTFTVNAAQTNLPAGYSVGDVSGTVPSPWDTNGTVYVVGSSSISFTAPATAGSYPYTVKWDETHSYGNKLTGGDAFVINLTVEEAGPTDTTPPVITITVPPDEATYILNQVVLADWTVTDEDSGVNWAATYGTVASGDPIDTSTVGTHEFYVYAEDNAGNSTNMTVHYQVVYNFGGFLPPLVINGQGNGLFKAGSTIPVKFQLTDYYGNPVSTASGTASINTSPAASAGIRYDATAMQYIANLKTPKGVTGNYIVTVTLDDGTSHTIGVKLQ
jgi:hypothetical protein